MVYQAPKKAQQLYDEDYNVWLESTIQQLKSSDFSAVDWENLIEELEDMGRSEKRAVYSNLKILLLHLLKYRYQPDKRSNSWKSSICEHRQRLFRSFRESPSLKRYFETVVSESYSDAQKLASQETELGVNIFPDECPFSPEEILDIEFLGE